MFNWLAVKKFIFSSIVICAAGTPIYLLNKDNKRSDEKTKNDEISELKKEFLLTNGSQIFTGTEYKNFLEELLKTDAGKEQIRNFFARLLSLTWFEQQGSSRNKQSIVSWNKEEVSEYQKQNNSLSKKEHFLEQNDLFDQHGGSREAMKKNCVAEKAYNSFKELLTTFFNHNFTINKNISQPDLKSFFVEENNYLDKNQIEKKEDWSKIGFYPTINKHNKNISNEEKKYLIGKFNFLNWAYKKWYAETLPFYTWMVLWKHSGDDLSSKYNLDKITDAKIKHNPNYNLPLFSGVGDKFKNFITNVVKSNSPEIPFVSKAYTDDSSTSIFTQASNSHSKLYSEFASAANYKFYKSIKDDTLDVDSCLNSKHKGNNTPTSTDAKTNNIHELKITDIESITDPLDLFLSKPSDSPQAPAPDMNGYIHIDKSIIKDGVGKTTGSSAHYTLYEAREVENKNWMFLRNQAGAHAIMIDHDAYTQKNANNCKIKSAFEFFNFRNLQLIHKQNLNLQNTVDVHENEALDVFKTYLKSNFDRLIIKYLFQNPDSKKYLFSRIDNSGYFEKFQPLLMLWDEMDFYQSKYMTTYDIRKRILGHYGNRSWDITTDANGVVVADKNTGLFGAFPYKFGTPQQTLFPDQEDLFSKVKYDKTEHKTIQPNGSRETPIEQYEALFAKLSDTIKELFKNLKLGIQKQGIDFINSSRIFFNDFVINNTYDSLLENKDLIDVVVKTIFLKKDTASYIKKELFDSGFLNKNTLFFSTPSTSAGGVPSTEEDPYTSFKKSNKLQDGFKQFVLSKFLYDKSNTNWFDPLIYQNTTNPNTDFKSFLNSASTAAFKGNYFFINKQLKKIYLDFLMALNYLLKDHYKNLRKILEEKSDHYSDSFFVFKKNKTTIEANKANLFANPFLNNHDSTHKTSFQFKKISELNSLIKYPEASSIKQIPPNTQKTEDVYNYQGIVAINEKTQSTELSYTHKNKNLFAFKDRSELVKYIRSCDESQFEDLVRKMTKKGFDMTWVKKKYITFTDSTTKDLTWQQRKNCLISFVNQWKMPSTTNIEEEKCKSIYGVDKSGASATASTSLKTSADTINYSENISDDDFKRQTKVDGSDKYIVQYNKDDLSDENNFKNFVKTNLNESSFAKIIFGILNESKTLTDAETDFFKSITQIQKVFDKKTKESLNTSFVAQN